MYFTSGKFEETWKRIHNVEKMFLNKRIKNGIKT